MFSPRQVPRSDLSRGGGPTADEWRGRQLCCAGESTSSRKLHPRFKVTLRHLALPCSFRSLHAVHPQSPLRLSLRQTGNKNNHRFFFSSKTEIDSPVASCQVHYRNNQENIQNWGLPCLLWYVYGSHSLIVTNLPILSVMKRGSVNGSGRKMICSGDQP